MLQNGIVPFDHSLFISADGQIRRFRTHDDAQGETSGAYCIFSEHWPAGWVEDWRNGKGAINCSFSRRLCNSINKNRLRLQNWLAILHFDHAIPASQNHSYLKAKNAPVLSFHQIDDKLIVALRDVNGRFLSLQ